MTRPKPDKLTQLIIDVLSSDDCHTLEMLFSNATDFYIGEGDEDDNLFDEVHQYAVNAIKKLAKELESWPNL